MKIRNGFVSNSSAASFCIYGWTDRDLKTDWAGVMDIVRTIWNKYNIRLVESSHPSDNVIVGVGTSEGEIDHNYCDGDGGRYEDWEDYRSPPPTKEQMAWLDEAAKDLGLPKPHLDSATWFDG